MVEHSNNAQTGKQEQEHRNRKVTFRLSESEYAQISEDVTICGLTISSLARNRLLGIRVASHADLAVLSELRRLGGLLKHIHNETRGAYSALTAQAIRDLSAYVRVLSKNAEKDRGVSQEESS
jgi:hypothetical protein